LDAAFCILVRGAHNGPLRGPVAGGDAVCMYYACMVALQIRDVSEEVREALVAQACARGQSLQAYLLELVETQARRLRNVAVLDSFAGRADGSRSLPGETSAELEEQRGAGGSSGAVA
jgi:hypothetical protein